MVGGLRVGQFKDVASVLSLLMFASISASAVTVAPQVPEAYDPKQIYTYMHGDLDANGVTDSFFYDRKTNAVYVRLAGPLPSTHPYFRDQAQCVKLEADHKARGYADPQPNLDYCSFISRPEEKWGRPPIRDPMNAALNLTVGRVATAGASLVIQEGDRFYVGNPALIRDPYGKRAPMPAGA